MLQKRNFKIFLLLFLIILVSNLCYSFTLNWEDKYGSPGIEWVYGDYNDKFVFKNRPFNINLTDIASDDMVCVEWNDFENEGGTLNTFEPNACFFVNGIGINEINGCKDYISDEYGAASNYFTNSYSIKLDFSMDTSVALDVSPLFKAFICDANKSNVYQDGSTEFVDFYIGSKRRQDCGASRTNNFNFQYFNTDWQSNTGWHTLNSYSCLLMTSAKNGQQYFDIPFNIDNGDVQCDEREDDNEVITYNAGIQAQHSLNNHPCTINEGIQLNASSRSATATCTYIDDDECQTGVCNADNVCGTCSIEDLYFESTGNYGDTDKNYILAVGHPFEFKPIYSEKNYAEGEGIDCIAYDTDGNGLYDICNGRINSQCTNLMDDPIRDPNCLSGNINDRDWYTNITKNSYGTWTFKAKALDISCNVNFEYNKDVSWKTVLASYYLNYDGILQNRQLRQDTKNITLTIENPSEDLTKYSCNVTCNNQKKEDIQIGSYLSGNNYKCNLDTSILFGSQCNIGDNISTSYSIFVDADVYYTYPNLSKSSEQIDSRSYYFDFGEGQATKKPKLNKGWQNNTIFPSECYYDANCTIIDNSSISSVGSAYSNDQVSNSSDNFNSVRINYTILSNGFSTITTKSYFDIYRSYNNWSWSQNKVFTSNEGQYNANLQVCYDYQRFPGYFYCQNRILAIKVPQNTLLAYLTAFNATSFISASPGTITKNQQMKFCLNTSLIGSNNTGIKTYYNYNSDGSWDINGTINTCLTHTFTNESGAFTAYSGLSSNEGRSSFSEFEYFVYGVCGDGYTDWDEIGIDDINATYNWSEKCYGTCDDNIQNGNEIDVDYGGRCGKCGNFSSYSEDISFELLKETNIGITYPFDENIECVKVQSISGSIMFIVVLGVLLLIILIIAGIFFLFPLIMFIFTGKYKWIFQIIKFATKKKKEKE